MPATHSCASIRLICASEGASWPSAMRCSGAGRARQRAAGESEATEAAEEGRSPSASDSCAAMPAFVVLQPDGVRFCSHGVEIGAYS